MTEQTIDWEQLEEDKDPTDSQLRAIAELAKKQIELEDWIEEKQKILDRAKERLEKLKGELLPEAMAQVGMTEFVLDNGAKITVKNDLNAYISEENRQWCFEWLRDNNQGAIIRREFKVSYGVGEQEQADSLQHILEQDLEVDFNLKEYVHHRTLPAFIKSYLLENNEDPPSEEWEKKFGVHRFSTTKVERPKR